MVGLDDSYEHSSDFVLSDEIIEEQIINPANALTMLRSVSAPFIGYAAWKGFDITGTAMAAAAATDLEGNVARWGAARGKLWLTEIGRKLDPVADKVLAVSVAGGTLANDVASSNYLLTGAVLAQQLAIAGLSVGAEIKSPGELRVSKVGKVGIGLVFGYLASKNMLHMDLVQQSDSTSGIIETASTAFGISGLAVVGLAMKNYVKRIHSFRSNKQQAS